MTLWYHLHEHKLNISGSSVAVSMLVHGVARTRCRGDTLLLQNFADDIGILANEEHCDVIVDDIRYLSE